jgi:uncharacterized membrane protein YjjP (DUF1212 family)
VPKGTKRQLSIEPKNLNNSALKKALHVAIYAGEIMLRSGADTARTEQTINYLLHSFGIERYSSIVTPTSILAAIDIPELEQPMTYVKRVENLETNLHRLSAVNDLSRKAAAGLLSLDEIEQELQRIESSRPLYPLWIYLLAASFVAATTTFLLGGGWLDAVVAFGGSLVVQIVLALLQKSKIPGIFYEFVGGTLATFIVFGLSGLPVTTSLITGGIILVLVPGAAMLASVGDGIAGNLVSSTARGLEALLKGASLALGVGFALALITQFGGQLPQRSIVRDLGGLPYQLGAAFVASAAFALSKQAPHRVIVPAGWAGALCFGSERLITETTSVAPTGIFVSAFLVGVFSWIWARRQQNPVTLYSLPGVVILLPGLTIYNGMLALSRERTLEGVELLGYAILVSGAIAAGVALSNWLVPAIWRGHKG